MAVFVDETSEDWVASHTRVVGNSHVLAELVVVGRSRRALAERSVGPVLVVVTDIFVEDASQVLFVEDEDPIQTFAFGWCRSNAPRGRSRPVSGRVS